MQSVARRNLVLAGAALLALTSWRLIALSLDSTDLWVDEAQYWLWGQRLDWGYFSKPPMIAWLSRAVTDLAGSDMIFWIRAPGPILHAITACLVGAIAAHWAAASHPVINTPGVRGQGPRSVDATGIETGIWAGLLYATAPFASLGSWQFSTDTVLLPFFACAVLALSKLMARRSVAWALILGLATGFGLLSKYAMIYLPVSALLAMLIMPAARIALRDGVLAALTALIVFSPNLIWNALNGAQTLQHTATDNAQLGTGAWSIARAAEFLAAQFAVAGPLLFAVWALSTLRALVAPRLSAHAILAWLSVPAIALMMVQAARAQAHANWGVTAYVAGIALVALTLASRPRWRWATLALNGAIAVIFPLLFIFAETIRLPDGRLLAARYVGAASFSSDVADAATDAGVSVIVAQERWLLADLFHTLRTTDVTIRAVPPTGKVANFYQADYPLNDFTGDVLYIEDRVPPPCASRLVDTLTPTSGVRAGRTFALHIVPARCFAR